MVQLNFSHKSETNCLFSELKLFHCRETYITLIEQIPLLEQCSIVPAQAFSNISNKQVPSNSQKVEGS